MSTVCYEQIGILYRFDTKQHRDIYHRFVYDGNRIAFIENWTINCDNCPDNST